MPDGRCATEMVSGIGIFIMDKKAFIFSLRYNDFFYNRGIL